MALTPSPDPFAGTVYRHLTAAEDAVGLARFHGVADGIGYDPAAALERVDDALEQLHAARALLDEAAH